MKVWTKKSQDQIKTIVFEALADNVNYNSETILGIPASYLDDKVFSQDAGFIKDAPFIKALIQNPNHIGCHTLGKSESFFSGTHRIERELIEICAVDILKGQTNQQDGYVASGGTEANLQAIWIYRNFFMNERGAKLDEICILCSEDSHYSMDKAANLMAISLFKSKVDSHSRSLKRENVLDTIKKAKLAGKEYFIVVANMMTTMFGSVDDVAVYTDCLLEGNSDFKVHIDGAYGGFYYPFSNDNSLHNFMNPHITSFTLDAHKMAQAPYGTGIFIIRKAFLKYANTKQASYVEGEDYTLIGSRSGANAIAVWMILAKNGPFGWQEKVFVLQKRTDWMCRELDALSIEFYRHPHSNIITIKSDHIQPNIATNFGLVPNNHDRPEWYKIVIMEHVTIEKLMLLIDSLKATHPLSAKIYRR